MSIEPSVSPEQPSSFKEDKETSISLRLVQDSDLDLLADWFSDREFIQWWKVGTMSREQVAEKYLNHRAGKKTFLVLEKDKPVGYIQAFLEKGFYEEPVGAIDLIIAPWAQGRGIGPRSAQLLVQILFNQFDCHYVSVDPHPENQRAVHSWHKAGFREIYREEDMIWMIVRRPTDKPPREAEPAQD